MQIVGHRGGRELATENTLKAIKASIKAGANAIEIDLRLSADNYFTVQHDPGFITPQGQTTLIARQSYKKILSCLPDMPSLGQVTKTVLTNHTKHELFLDCKDRHFARELSLFFDSLKKQGYDTTRIIVLSFYARELAAFKKMQPAARIYYLFRYGLFFHLLICKYIGAEGAGYNWRYTLKPLPWLCHRHRLKIYYYTVNNPRLANIFKRRGVDYLATDRPDAIREALDI